RDEAAFAELVRRHGPMVLGVCRRVLRNEHDAEDTFQATFLVLARQASSVRKRASLGGFLHEVAYHIALRARQNAVRRRTWERQIRDMTPSDPVAESARRELRPLLDEELRHLPEKYREPLILCYLEGKTNEETARHLGWPLGSLSRRLARGRELLRRRLLRRGVTLSAALLTTALVEEAATAVPPVLIATAVRMAVCGGIAEGVSASVTALVQGRVQEMFLTKLRMALVLFFAAIGSGAGMIAYQARAAKPAEENRLAAKDAEQPTAAAEKQTRTDLYGDPLPPGALMRLGSVRLRRLGSTIAYSADGKTLISFSSRDKIIRHWDPATGRERRGIVLQGAEHMKLPDPCIWTWNERIVAMGSEGQLVLWDASTGKERRRIETAKTNGRAIALSPSGDTLAAAMQADKAETIPLWDTASGKVRLRLDHSAMVTELAFSPDGKLLGAVSSDLNLHIWEAGTGKRVRTIQNAGRPFAFSPDGTKVAAADRDDVVKIWSMADEREAAVLPKVERRMAFFSMLFSPDSKVLATAGMRDIVLFDVANQKLLRRIPTCGWTAFAPDGKTLASGINAIRLWDTATGQEISPRPGHDGPVDFLAVTPDGRRAVSLSPFDGFIHLWDVASGKSVIALPAGHFREFHSGALSSDGKRFASGGTDGKVRVWDLPEVKEVRQFSSDLRNAQGMLNPEIIALSFSSQDHQLAAVSLAWPTRSGSRPKYQLDLWDLDNGKSLARRELAMEQWPAYFRSDGRAVVFRTNDGLVMQDVATGREWANLSGNLRRPFVLSPDGQLLAATIYKPRKSSSETPSSDDPSPEDAEAIVLTELATGKRLLRIETGTNGFNRLAFAPDGRTLATADQDSFRLWDVATGKELFRRALPEKGHMSGFSFATSLAFLPSGDRLATGLMGGTILIWDLEPKTWRAGMTVKDLDRRALERLWNDLAGEDSGKAHQAVWTLAAAPAKVIPFLKDRLRPASPVDAKQLQRLIDDLDSAQFAVREDARKKLASFGEQAEPVLRQALEGKPSLEARKRLEALHADAERASRGIVRSAEALRTLRAIRALEAMDATEARQVLQRVASGDPAARTTRQAKEVLRRLERRTSAAPEPSGD
ncbi:MAG TPA: sigma-70 family RNA polymerase sigma factor, partial [Gemmataceae bacterium]